MPTVILPMATIAVLLTVIRVRSQSVDESYVQPLRFICRQCTALSHFLWLSLNSA